MRSIHLKHSLASEGRLSLTAPVQQLGYQASGCFIYRIDNIPEDVTDTEAIEKANGTIFYFRDKGDRAHTANFEELAIGFILDHPKLT